MNTYKFLLILYIFLTSCNERMTFTYDDAVRNEVDYFFEPHNESMKFTHNLENAEITGVFIPKNINNYIITADSLARKNNWKCIVNDQNKKIYLRSDIGGNYRLCVLQFYGPEVHLRMLTF